MTTNHWFVAGAGFVFAVIGVVLVWYQFIRPMGCTAKAKGMVNLFRQTYMGHDDVPALKLTYTVNGVEYDRRVSEDGGRRGDTLATSSLTYKGIDVEQAGGVAVDVFYNPSNPKRFYAANEKSNAGIVGAGFIILGSLVMLWGFGEPRLMTQGVKSKEFVYKILTFISGLFFASLGGFGWRRDYKLLRACAAKAPGVVTEIRQTTSRGGKGTSVSYTPVFAYSVEGVQYVREGSGGSKFSVGDSVTVFYDPSEPERFYILEEGKSTAPLIAVSALGAVLMIIASVALTAPKMNEKIMDTMVFFLVGSLIAGPGVFMMKKRNKLKNDCTAQADGVVTDCARPRKGLDYCLEFKYKVEGVEYVNSVDRLSKYSEGRVTVYYDPSAPSRSYADKLGVTSSELFFIAFGAVFMIGPIFK